MNDVVYFCKKAESNEELVYSIRSVVENFPHRKIWVYGGCPNDLKVPGHIPVYQSGMTKWDKVRNMYKMAAANKDITEDFYLFNDDFFVMSKVKEIPNYYRCTLPENILKIEMNYGDRPNGYTKVLRKAYKELMNHTEPVLSYELHVPFLFNREKLAQLIKNYPDFRCTRSMYGNLYQIGGVKMDDVKVYGGAKDENRNLDKFASTDDLAWREDHFGIRTKIQELFPNKSPYEK